MTALESGVLADFKRRVIAAFEWFLPDSVRKNSREEHRARMFLISHFLGPIIATSVPLSFYAVDPTPGAAPLVLGAAIWLFWVFPFLLKAEVSYRFLLHMTCLIDNFAVLWSWYHYGAAASPTLVWVVVIPLLTLFYVGADKWLATELMINTMVSVALFFVLFNAFPPPAHDIAPISVQALGLVSIVSASLYVSMMAIYYARMYTSGVSLEEEAQARMKRTREARIAISELDRAGTARASFLASMSHELRTPLNAVIGYSQVLREDAEDEGDSEVLSDLDRIHTAGQYLLRTINGILDLAKIEAGRMEVDWELASIEEIVEGEVEARRSSFEEKGVLFQLDAAQLREKSDRIDVVKLRNVVGTLLDNARDHADASAVTVCVARKDTSVEISIMDDGRGISSVEHERIFDGFGTVTEATDNQYGGTGLSLAVAHGLCTVMGAKLAFAPVQTGGCHFSISIAKVVEKHDAAAKDRRSVTAPALEGPAPVEQHSGVEVIGA